MKKILVAAAAALLAGTSANAATILNGSFETGSPLAPINGFSTLNAVDNTIDNWTVSQGSVDWVHTGFWTAQDGDYSIDLGGSLPGDTNGWIEQTFATTVGTFYTVGYWLSGNPDGANDAGKNARVNVLLNGSVFDFSDITGIQGASRTNMNWEFKEFGFTAVGPTTTLRFQSTEGSEFGAVIDNISITPVPEPATWAMLIGGFGLVGGAMRRRNRIKVALA